MSQFLFPQSISSHVRQSLSYNSNSCRFKTNIDPILIACPLAHPSTINNIYFFSWQDLKDFMRKAGEVTYGAAHDGEVGKNRGIVCFERKKDAERAVDDLDGRELNGRTVSYHYKRPMSKWLILERKFFPF